MTAYKEGMALTREGARMLNVLRAENIRAAGQPETKRYDAWARPQEPFVLSIEPLEGPTYRHGFHLGTDEAVARRLAEEAYRRGNAIRTVALMRDDRVFDVFDGTWSSERGFDDSGDQT